MSIQSMTNRDTVEFRRLTTTDSGEGVAVKEWTSLARGSLPKTGFKCRIQALQPEEIIAYGLRAGVKAWKIYSSSNPFADERDHVLLSDSGGSTVEARVIHPSFDWDRQGRLWKLVAQLFSPGD